MRVGRKESDLNQDHEHGVAGEPVGDGSGSRTVQFEIRAPGDGGRRELDRQGRHERRGQCLGEE